MRGDVISLEEARHITVTAAGYTDILSDTTELQAAFTRLGVVQLDSIGTFARAHQLTLAGRASSTRDGVDEFLWGDGISKAFELWVHAASLVPIEDWPLWQFRMQRTRDAQLDWAPEAKEKSRILSIISSQGPSTMSVLRDGGAAGSGWNWGPTKLAVEHMVWTGELVCAQRRNWQRVFDLPERALPVAIRDAQVSADDSMNQLMNRALDVLGVATAKDLADYYRMRPSEAAKWLKESPLAPVQVQGWRDQAWISSPAVERARISRAVNTFVGPFDNLIWYRPRVERLFHFRQVFEAYKPSHRREFGYYVCPLLVDGTLVGRADISLDQETLTLRRLSFEEGKTPREDGVVSAIQSTMTMLPATRVRVTDIEANFASRIGKALGEAGISYELAN
ncbi:crosslink repair DNA glycosylase YcaQ family protein [Arthrobacter sp. UYEF3]|uniref:winged helix-turn-helix domain-containing protein n=1 Tax=Arthrobacter sp. UYEF3 TaxID=1756365 RepID=UPI00339987E2